ncbi:MAG: tetratricopeptide repeat protein [Bryobacteraceae bacterium]
MPRRESVPNSAVFAAVVASAVACAFGQGRSAEEMFRQAQAASRQNDYARAERLYREILAGDPTILSARVNLGLACYWQSKPRAALAEFQKALEMRPREFSALLFSGLAYIDLTEYDRAQAMLEQARELNNGDPLLFWALGSLAMIHNDANAAVPALERCAELDPNNVRCRWLLGSAYAMLAYGAQKPSVRANYGERVDATLAWMREHQPNSALLHVFQGDVFAARTSTDEALREYQQAQALDPDWPDIHLLIGSLLGLQGRFDEAKAELKRQLTLHPGDTRALVESGSVSCRATHYAEAVPLLKEALSRDANNYEANYRLGQAYLSLEKAPAAVAYLERAARVRPEKSSSYYLLYRAYRTLGQREKAAGALATFRKLKSAGG